ncbi:MAG: hypothetical protein IJA09_01925 [Bacteroidales bacterium]|nr:hypothetical protein [Bacteroidales bacterium]
MALNRDSLTFVRASLLGDAAQVISSILLGFKGISGIKQGFTHLRSCIPILRRSPCQQIKDLYFV